MAGGTAIVTRTGNVVDLLNPAPSAFTLTEIALALSRLPRFGGHTSRTWSVADHSLLVVDLLGEDAPPDIALAGLLHDGHEPYTGGDIATPAVNALRWECPAAADALDALKRRVDGAVAHAFTLDPALFYHDAVRAADRLALAIEGRHLRAKPKSVWANLPRLPEFIPDLPKTSQETAQNRFLLRGLALLKAHRATRAAPVGG